MSKETISELKRIPGSVTHPEVKKQRQEDADKRSEAFAKEAKEELHAKAKLHEDQEHLGTLVGLVANHDFVGATEIVHDLLNNRVVSALDAHKRTIAQNLFVPVVAGLEEETHAYKVHHNNKHIDTVFYGHHEDPEEVKRSLVNHDGYDPEIKVTKERRKKK